MQPRRVELADGEWADAALCASGATDEPRAAAPDGIGERGVDDLDEKTVAGRERRFGGF